MFTRYRGIVGGQSVGVKYRVSCSFSLKVGSLTPLLVSCIAFWSFFSQCSSLLKYFLLELQQISSVSITFHCLCLIRKSNIQNITATEVNYSVTLADPLFKYFLGKHSLTWRLSQEKMCLPSSLQRSYSIFDRNTDLPADMCHTTAEHIEYEQWKAAQVFHYAFEPRSFTSDRTPAVSSNSGCVAWGLLLTVWNTEQEPGRILWPLNACRSLMNDREFLPVGRGWMQKCESTL